MKMLRSIVLVSVIALAGCTKNFEEINTNPNAPAVISNPGLLLPDAMRGAINANYSGSYDRGGIVANLLASDYASNFSNWSRSDANGYFLWNNYNYIRDLNEVIKLSEAQGLNNYKGVALVLRSWMFQCLTDIYGPIPFRQASNAKLAGINTPVYEQQDVIYQGLLTDLEEANSLLGSTAETMVGDIMYGSDVTKWKKFANGLALRILLRQSKRVDPSVAMKKIVEHPEKYPLFSSNTEQAALQYITERTENESPFYRSNNSSTDTKASKQLVDYLKSINDTRLRVYAQPTPASSAPDANGVRPDPSAFQYTGDLNGMGRFPDANLTSSPGPFWASIQANPTLASATAGQGILLSYSEVQFTLAEAAELGYISGGSAAAAIYYKNGIADQFAYYAGRIPSAYAATYIKLTAADVFANDDYYAQSGVVYSGTTTEKLDKIWLQKWISLYMVGYEAWSEWRRTGFPVIPIGTTGPGYIPRRVLYPADEMRVNKVNYDAAVLLLDKGDALNSHVWWDK